MFTNETRHTFLPYTFLFLRLPFYIWWIVFGIVNTSTFSIKRSLVPNITLIAIIFYVEKNKNAIPLKIFQLLITLQKVVNVFVFSLLCRQCETIFSWTFNCALSGRPVDLISTCDSLPCWCNVKIVWLIILVCLQTKETQWTIFLTKSTSFLEISVHSRNLFIVSVVTLL